MPSRAEHQARPRRSRPVVLLALLAWALAAMPAVAATASGLTTREQVQAAVEALRQDPDMPGTRTETQWRLKRDDGPANAAQAPQRERSWLQNLLLWLGESGRVLVWLAGAALVAVLSLRLWRWSRVRGPALPQGVAPAPSHVRHMDIRPDSLPADIGTAAAALWERGERQAALSLLYRGALSRLVHGHGVAVRAASTEGECLALAQAALPAAGAAHFTQLVHTWQQAVYGAQWPDSASALALCTGFDHHFAAVPASTAPAR